MTSHLLSSGQLRLAKDALIRESCGRCSLFHLRTGHVFGLDEVGARMWSVLLETGSVAAAYPVLSEEYDDPHGSLLSDFSALVQELLAEGLLGVAA